MADKPKKKKPDVQKSTPRKGLKADYQGATPEEVAKAVLRYRPGKKKDEE